ncbi:hypothetical protein SAMN06264364_13710 [Quadrisphaera granulorum]|uniref:Uncharacterized protein n=1 Tax=Quadrisphaera granulorum TaxID=317664 RepID=A0A316ACG8_9ACTN|nr:hypothetical protein [Quadrisphaera granulorum]PWJ47467.1 hypothetical protein BXY45_13710 [Quadrisphaera granulorum]SZE98768.1 hypothetical protein SAMN06264364_13710 [Quadrisphaera granulorum]
MTRHVLGGLQAAAAVLLACGVLVGVTPVPLASFGCGPAFSSGTFESGTSMDVVFACAEERSQRQLGAAAFLTLGGALLAGASLARTRTRTEPRSATEADTSS